MKSRFYQEGELRGSLDLDPLPKEQILFCSNLQYISHLIGWWKGYKEYKRNLEEYFSC